jgi:mannose-6-phosphate isomerase
MECMANSDNVIRAGLTPKLRDIPSLIANLTYNARGRDSHVVKPAEYRNAAPQATTMIYDPPILEFSVLRTKADTSSAVHTHEAVNGPSVLIATEGGGEVGWGNCTRSRGADFDTCETKMAVQKGDVFFVGAGCEVGFRTIGSHPLVVYRAFLADE